MWTRCGTVLVTIDRGEESMRIRLRRPTLSDVDAWLSVQTRAASITMREYTAAVDEWIGALFVEALDVVDADGNPSALVWSEVVDETTARERRDIVAALIDVQLGAGAVGKSSVTLGS